MRVLIFGATGMVGQGALRECLADERVSEVVTVGRTAAGASHPRLREITLPDLFAIAAVAGELGGFDACFYCLGVSVVGLNETDYAETTWRLPMTIARVLAPANPDMTFVHVSAAGADPGERSRFMWARIKGRTERELRALPFKALYVLRPGFIQPLHGIKSKTRLYRALYALTGPLATPLGRAFPHAITTTERIGKAMIALAAHGSPLPVLDNAAINQISHA